MTKKLVQCLLVTVSAFGVVSCGGTDGGGETLRFWHAMGGPLGRSLGGLVTDYNAANPDGALESVSMGRYQALSQKIMAAVAAGGPPDVAQCYEAWAANLIENGSLAPVSPSTAS